MEEEEEEEDEDEDPNPLGVTGVFPIRTDMSFVTRGDGSIIRAPVIKVPVYLTYIILSRDSPDIRSAGYPAG
jgi:hypothetical protein